MAKKIFTASKEDFELFLKNIEKTKKPSRKESAIEALMKRLRKWPWKNNWSPVFHPRSWVSMLA